MGTIDHGKPRAAVGATDDRNRVQYGPGNVADEHPAVLPEFLAGQPRPRDLRTAEELESQGYPVPAAVAAWLVEPGDMEEEPVARSPLFSTSAARRGRGDDWLRPGREQVNGPTQHTDSVRSALAPRTVAKDRLPGGRPRRVSAHGDPRRWLGELFHEGFVVIDTETTGLSARDEIIEVAAVSSDGTVLFESRLRPRRGSVPAASTRIHGLTIADLEGAPSWPEVLDELHKAVAGHRILAWNALFDERLSVQTSRAWAVPHPLPGFECAMRAYAYARGVGSGSFKLERAATVEGVLSAGQSHRSADDARLTLAVLKSLHRRADNLA